MAVDPGNNVKPGSALVLDSANRVHIAYNTAMGLKIATNKTGSWTISSVDSNSGTGGSCVSMVIGHDNIMHISYYDSNNNQLKYAEGTENSWSITNIDYLASSARSCWTRRISPASPTRCRMRAA